MLISNDDYSKKHMYENKFYLTCDTGRIGKLIAHYELLKETKDLPGIIAEFGVFKGVSFARWAMLRDLLGLRYSKKLLGFDIFGKFPETKYLDDVNMREKFITAAGDESISYEEMLSVLEKKEVLHDVTLIKGDILKTLPDYLRANPETKFSFINLDTDIYEPAKCILECCWDRLVKGGILLLDDYTFFAGENKAVDDFFADKNVEVKISTFAKSPCYVQKK